MVKNGFIALVVLVVLSLGLVTAVSAYAQDGTDSNTQTNVASRTQSPPTTGTNTSSEAMQAAENAREASQAAQSEAEKEVEMAKGQLQATGDRLQGDHLMMCEAHQKAINTIMAQAAARGSRQMSLFGTITSRVESFYASKGKTLTNYNQLVANATSAQATAQSAVQAVQSADIQFNCGGSNPAGQVNVFRTLLKQMETALEQYRTAIKSLIVGVKSVQSTITTNGAK